MKKVILAGILLCVMAFSGCVQREPEKKTSAEHEVAMKTVEGREAFIAEELYEGAEILSEFKNEETGFIVSEFMAGDIHSFILFRPTEKGYAYNGEADVTLDDMVTETLWPLGDGDYNIFLRHSDDIVSLDVTYIDAETNEILQNGTVTFAEGNLALMLKDEEITHWRTRIVAHDKDGQEYVLQDGEPPEFDPIAELEKEKDWKFIKNLIKYPVIFVALYWIGERRRKK